jgi:glycosyltransferase involved in cell wall biosynthesis
MTQSLSAIIIAKNEQRDLPRCLHSITGIADEIIIVVSDDTSDETESIARGAGAKVQRRAFDDYARQRQASLDMATSDWCLWIDPDEYLSHDLGQEIKNTIANTKLMPCGYHIPFEVKFLGRALHWGGLGSESHLRLFKRHAAKFSGGKLHEFIVLSGSVGKLTNKMIHEPYQNISDYLSKLDRYTTLAAKKRQEQGRHFHLWHHLLLPWEFFARVFIKLGILDGFQGIIWAGLSAFHSWLKYVKLGLMDKGFSNDC